MSRRFLILAEGNFGPLTSKTANACIRYVPGEVVAVLDSTQAGRTAQEILGFGGALPVVASFAEGMAHTPRALLIGIAPAGGQFPSTWRTIVCDALRAGLDVWSGLHTMLGDDPEFAAIAQVSGAAIRDLRRAPADLEVGSGRVRDLEATIGLTVPVVVIAAIVLDLPLVLGLGPKNIVLLATTLLVCVITVGTGRTSVMQGAVHLVLFATYVFLACVP